MELNDNKEKGDIDKMLNLVNRKLYYLILFLYLVYLILDVFALCI